MFPRSSLAFWTLLCVVGLLHILKWSQSVSQVGFNVSNQLNSEMVQYSTAKLFRVQYHFGRTTSGSSLLCSLNV